MRSRRPSPQQLEVLARRLASLSADAGPATESEPQPELEPEPEPEPAVWRPADPDFAAAFQPWAPPAVDFPEPMAPGRHAARLVGLTRLRLLPEPIQQRFVFGAPQLSVIAVVVALGLAVTAWWAIHTRPHSTTATGSLAQPLAEPSASVSALLPVESPNPSSGAATTELVVDVSGKVRRPGIAILGAGARVVDAIEAAGGVRRGVDLGALNLARLLVDGEQILVGVPQPEGVGAAAAAPPSGAAGQPLPGGTLVNLNTAGQVELETLPGVGPVTAQAIITWRTDNAGFGAVEELLDVQGIGEATLAQIAPRVTV